MIPISSYCTYQYKFIWSFVLTKFSRDKLRTKDRTKFVAHPSPPRDHLDDGLPIIARPPNFITAFNTSQTSSPCFPAVEFKVFCEYEHHFGSCEFEANQKIKVSPCVLLDAFRSRDRESLLRIAVESEHHESLTMFLCHQCLRWNGRQRSPICRHHVWFR